MAGGHYTALSGMRTRLDALDRLASDIANASTAGYKAERAGTIEAGRPSFGVVLQSAIDVTGGPARLDLRNGALATTGRSLDVAIEGEGFFVVETAAGPRYTRNGRFTRRPDGVLTTPDGDEVQGASGPITVGVGDIHVDGDGTIRSGTAVAGRLAVVTFDPEVTMVRENALRMRADGGEPKPVDRPSVSAGSLEQSNVSIVERLAELSTVTRNFETLQRALTVLMNDVDNRAITELGRR
jgi:flagellar basal body rod protein FlgG